jgi:hypothetical protein
MRGAVIKGEDWSWVILGGALGGSAKCTNRLSEAGGALGEEVVALPDIEVPTGFVLLWRA